MFYENLRHLKSFYVSRKPCHLNATLLFTGFEFEIKQFTGNAGFFMVKLGVARRLFIKKAIKCNPHNKAKTYLKSHLNFETHKTTLVQNHCQPTFYKANLNTAS